MRFVKRIRFLFIFVMSLALLSFSMGAFADATEMVASSLKKTQTLQAEEENGTAEKNGEGTSAENGILPELKPLHGTGIFQENGVFRYYEKGVFKNKTGVALCPEDGKWCYVKNGISSPETTGIVKRLSDGKWVYVRNGVFTESTGVAKRLSDGDQLYVKNGVFSKTTGIANRLNSKKSVYVENGRFNKKTGLVQKADKQWVFVRKGVVVTNPKKFRVTKADEKAGRGELLCKVYAKCIYDSIIGSKKMSKRKKLLKCFQYIVSPHHYSYLMNRIPYYTEEDWPIIYTLDMIRDGGSTCFGYNALFGYLAKLCGCDEVYFCCIKTHGWAEIDGLVFDLVFIAPPRYQMVFETTYEEADAMGLGEYYTGILRRIKAPEF